MDENQIIAEVARRNGVLLAPNDPIMQIHTMIEMHEQDRQEREAKLTDVAGEIERRIAPLLAEIRALTAQQQNPQPVLSEKAIRQVAYEIAQKASDRLERVSRWSMARGIALLAAGAVALGGAMLAVGYWWGSRTEAERYVHLPAEYNIAMSNHDAERWLDLMRKNTAKGALDGCKPAGEQANGGTACTFTLWTEPPRNR